eukprot:10059713-Alexandrium_andersonii.AAC.1
MVSRPRDRLCGHPGALRISQARASEVGGAIRALDLRAARRCQMGGRVASTSIGAPCSCGQLAPRPGPSAPTSAGSIA